MQSRHNVFGEVNYLSILLACVVCCFTINVLLSLVSFVYLCEIKCYNYYLRNLLIKEKYHYR